MLKILSKTFELVNATLGVASLATFAAGTVSVFTSIGLVGLSKVNIKPVSDYQMGLMLNGGVNATTYGGIGFLVATSAAAAFGTALSELERENQGEEKISDTPTPARNVVVPVPLPLFESTNDLYLYQIMRIDGIRAVEGELVVGRFDSSSSINRKTVVYDVLDSRSVDSLSTIYDCNDDDLAGKAFSSAMPLATIFDGIANPLRAAHDYISYRNPPISNNNFGSATERCRECSNFFGQFDIVCGLYPYGYEDADCPDLKLPPSKNEPYLSKDKRPQFAYEKVSIVESFDNAIKPNLARLYKNDNGTVTLVDEHKNRRFCFTWRGVLLDDSDRLLDLGEHAQLSSYIHYFSVRAAISFDYSSKIDEFATQLRGIALIRLCRDGRGESNYIIEVETVSYPRSTVKMIYTHRFRLDGAPHNPYSWSGSTVPPEIKYDYNLVNFVQWLTKLQPKPSTFDKIFFS